MLNGTKIGVKIKLGGTNTQKDANTKKKIEPLETRLVKNDSVRHLKYSRKIPENKTYDVETSKFCFPGYKDTVEAAWHLRVL